MTVTLQEGVAVSVTFSTDCFVVINYLISDMATLTKLNRLAHPVYEVYKCQTMNRIFDVENDVADDAFLFRVKIYLIFTDKRVFTFYNPTDWVDNVNLMRECGSFCSTFTHDIYVSPTSHPDIYKEIRDYVSQSHSD